MPPLMPRAVAVWLLDHTTLTFPQIAHFCEMHLLEIRGIADGDIAGKVQAKDPIASFELSREEITRCEKDETAQLQSMQSAPVRKRKEARYTPLAKRQSKPQAIAWLLRNHPKVRDAQIIKLIGTTRKMIGSIRDRSYWNIANVQPQDPVLSGLCSQQDLVLAVAKHAEPADPVEKPPSATQ